MASSEDFKKLYELYQTEGVSNGVSIVDYPHQSGADDSAKQPNLPQLLLLVEKLVVLC